MSDNIQSTFNGVVKGAVIGDNNTVTLVYHSEERRTIPFLAPPKPTHQLVGREGLLRELKQRLFGGESLGLFALGGLPGVGKTALAVALAHDLEVLGHYPDGVLWAGLGRDADVLLHLGRWGAALGISSQEMARLRTVEDRANAVTSAIGTRRMLLVADDAWNDRVALSFQIGGLNCGHVVTTRLSDVAKTIDKQRPVVVNELSEDDGLALLAQLAPEVARANPDRAKELVNAVGGLPLALTLMGSYLRLKAGIQTRLEMALEKLADPEAVLNLQMPLPPGASVSEISLMAAIEISDQSLRSETRQMLYSLSVFPSKPNSFPEYAAIKVSGISSRQAAQEALFELYDFGLLESNGTDRYTLHQTIAEYSRVKLADRGPFERLVQYYVDLVSDDPDFNLLDQELNNVLSALKTAFDRGMYESLIAGANGFSEYLDARGANAINQVQLNRAKHAAEYLGDTSGLATTLLNLGRIAEKRGNFAEAEGNLKEGLAIARQVHDKKLMSSHLLYLGVVEFNRGNYDQAEAYSQESLSLIEPDQEQDRGKISALHMRLGMVNTVRGELEEAEKEFHHSLDLAQRIRDNEKICSLQTKLALVHILKGKYVSADHYVQTALAETEKLGNLQRNCSLDLVRGMLECAREQYDKAGLHLKQGMETARQIEHRWYMSSILNEYGELYLIPANRQRNRDEAKAAFLEAHMLAGQMKSEDLRALALYGLARVAREEGWDVEAEHKARESLLILKRLRHRSAAPIEKWLSQSKASIACSG